MSPEYEAWKAGDVLASNKGGSRWSYLQVPWLAKVVEVHGKRDITLRMAWGREERMTRLAAARAGWRLATDADRNAIALDKARNECMAALDEVTKRARDEQDAERLRSLTALVEGWR